MPNVKKKKKTGKEKPQNSKKKKTPHTSTELQCSWVYSAFYNVVL